MSRVVFHVSRLWPRPDALRDPIAFRETASNFSTCHVPFLPRRKRGVFFFGNFFLPWIPEGTLFSALRRGTGRMGGGDNGTQNWPQFFSASSFSSSSSGLFSSLRAILVGGGRGTREKVPALPLLFPLLFPPSSFRPPAGQPVRAEPSFRKEEEEEDAGGEFVRSMEEEEEEASDYH